MAPDEVQLVLNNFQKIQQNAISATEETVERILQVLYELQRRAQITLAFTIKQWEKKKEDDDNTNKNEMKEGDDGFGGLLDAIFKPKAPKGPILSAKEIIAAAAQKRKKATSTAATTASTTTSATKTTATSAANTTPDAPEEDEDDDEEESDGDNDAENDAEINTEKESSTGTPTDDENNKDESGLSGDHNGFFRSLLTYIRDTGATIRNTSFKDLLEELRQSYVDLFPNRSSDLQIENQLDGSGESKKRPIYGVLLQNLATSLAVQFRRYFIDKEAGLNTSLPLSPVRLGFFTLSEHDLWFHLQRRAEIRDYFKALGEDIGPINSSLKEEKPIGWLFNRLFTTVGEGMLNPIWKDDERIQSNFARNTMTATLEKLECLRSAIADERRIEELRSSLDTNDKEEEEELKELLNKRDRIKEGSSSEFLVAIGKEGEYEIKEPKEGQPVNVLPSYVLSGNLTTNGKVLYLGAINLRIRKKQRFLTEHKRQEDGKLRRVHVLANDHRRLLPSLATVMREQPDLIPHLDKVNIDMIDLGKANMVAFSCIRSGSEFRYTMVAKTKAIYQPTFRARSESNRTGNTVQIKTRGERVGDPEFTVTVAQYEKELCSLDTNPCKRLEQERTTQFEDLKKHYNKGLRHRNSNRLLEEHTPANWTFRRNTS